MSFIGIFIATFAVIISIFNIYVGNRLLKCQNTEIGAVPLILGIVCLSIGAVLIETNIRGIHIL